MRNKTSSPGVRQGHVAPPDGLQAYAEPYPPYPAPRDAYIPGGETLEVRSIRGAWAEVAVNGLVVGWVEGRRLVPPLPEAHTLHVYSAPAERLRTIRSQAANGLAVTANGLVGAFAAIGVVVGALLTWTKPIDVDSFDVPIAFLFDFDTASRDPKLGPFLIGAAIVALVASFFRGGASWRVLGGAVAFTAAALFCIQVARQLAEERGGPTLGDVVGLGPWIAGASGLALAISPALRRRD
jgi:hypothetical protein